MAWSFGAYLRERRAALGVSIVQLGEMLGVSAAYISHLEVGRRTPSEELLRRCAEVCGERVEFLRFLLEPTTEQEKKDVAYGSAPPDFIPMALRVPVSSSDDEGHLVIPLLRHESVPPLDEDTPLHMAAETGDFADGIEFQSTFLDQIDADPAGFPEGVSAWAALYRAHHVRLRRGRSAAVQEFGRVAEQVQSSPGSSPRLVYLSNLHYGLSLASCVRYVEAETRFNAAYAAAAVAPDARSMACAVWHQARAALEQGDYVRARDLYRNGAEQEGIGPIELAQCRAGLLQTHGLLWDNEAAVSMADIAQAAWRTRTTGLPQAGRTAALVCVQLSVLEACVRLGSLTDAERWLSRVRTILNRVEVDDVSVARAKLCLADVMVLRGGARPAVVRARVEEACALPFGDDVLSRTVRTHARDALAALALAEARPYEATGILSEMEREDPMPGIWPELGRQTRMAAIRARTTSSVGDLREASEEIDRVRRQVTDALAADDDAPRHLADGLLDLISRCADELRS